MNTVEHVVAQPVGTQRAAVAHSVLENLPRVGEVVLVLPKDAEHLAVVARLGLAHQAERNRRESRVSLEFNLAIGRQRLRRATLEQVIESLGFVLEIAVL
jgi:hypothetical protein